MRQNHRYTLETPRVTGRRQQKTVCPQCGRKSLVRYVDTENQCQYLHDAVGKCDHENSCGYHYKPSEFFRDHPQHRTQSADYRPMHLKTIEPKPEPLIAIDMDYVRKSCSTASTFWQWMTAIAPRLGADSETLRRVLEAYYIGTTKRGSVIFWQIDEQQQVHTGHIMSYNLQGHRNGYQNWTHAMLQKQQQLPSEYQPPKCFFGQHLLNEVDEEKKHEAVCIVESEKTALVMALIHPQYLWLATAGCGGLSSQKTACLQGRRVLLFPDSGCMEKWRTQMQQTTGIDWRISAHLEHYPPNTDLVDLLGI